MANTKRRNREPIRKARADERKQLENAVASIDGGTSREDKMPLEDTEREPDGAQPFADGEK